MRDDSLIACGVWGSGRVELFCGACTWSKSYPAATVIRRVKARGFGTEALPVAAVARFVQWPCPACGRMRWGSRPAARSGRRS